MDNRPLVLVADRQPEFTRLVALSLGREGFRVEAAHDGLSALDKVSELNPDLLLLGVDLPDPSGMELLDELRESHPLPVILVDEQSAASAVSAIRAPGVVLLVLCDVIVRFPSGSYER